MIVTELTVHPLVHVHALVPEILPGIHYTHTKPHLNAGNDHPIDRLGHQKLPCRECRHLRPRHSVERGSEERIVSACQGSGDQWVRTGHVLCNRCSVQPEKAESSRKRALRQTDAGRPDGNLIVLHARLLAIFC